MGSIIPHTGTADHCYTLRYANLFKRVLVKLGEPSPGKFEHTMGRVHEIIVENFKSVALFDS